MVSTKMTPKVAKEYVDGPSVGDAPAYSYGTSLCLDDELLRRLGFTTPPAVGTELTLRARVVVTSTSENQQQDGDKVARCDLQITDMELNSDGPDMAQRMYG
ncbi:capsid staple protein [Variovorax sp.]|uniref:capsid staple protein n=1 Tax=Variovorax sp. TaxID=1871043 RepID=UPI003BAC3D08